MRASESPFELCISDQILSFAYLMGLSVSLPKALKTCFRFAIFNFSEKLQNIFEIGLKKYVVVAQKSLSLKKYFERNTSQTRFWCLCVNLPTVKVWGQSKNSQWILAFYSVLVKWKNWIGKTALNMSIRRVIFTSGQNLKPPFLCQYLIVFNDFFLH